MTSIEIPTAPAPALRGRVVRPGDAGFEELRAVHNAKVDRRPALIACVADAGDIATALAYARERDLAVAVRGGGHSTAGHGTVDGGMVIDMRAMKGIAVDPSSLRVRVQAGVTWAELDAATQQHGLAVTGARAPEIGVVGCTLGSGSGWLERSLGLTADALCSARVVTADGSLVTARPTEHPDLFWALRGGGGNFGVVTELELQAAPVGPRVVGGVRLYALERAEEVMSSYDEVMREAPEQLCGGMALRCMPPDPSLPEVHNRGPVVAVVVMWAGEAADAAAGLAPLDRLGTPLADRVQPVPYTALQRLLERERRGPVRSYLKCGFLGELSTPAVETFAALAGELCTRDSQILLQPMGGAFARTGAAETALGERDARWAFQLLTQWEDPSEDAPNVAWTRAAAAELAESGRPAPYPNLVADDGRRRLAVAYAPATLERLRQVKRAWDPDNVFRVNHNIPPA